MPKFAELEKWMKAERKTQASLAKDLGIPGQQGRISRWLKGTDGINEQHRTRLRELGFNGPWPEDVTENETDNSEIDFETPTYLRNPGPSLNQFVQPISRRVSIERDATRLVIETLKGSKLEGALEKEEEDQLIDLIADGLAVGRTPEEIISRLSRLLDLFWKARSGELK